VIKNKIKVLIVEDSRLYQTYLKQIIESDDCLCVVGIADCGRQALELIPERKPDIITLDLQLPDLDGFTLLSDILLRWSLPVIVVSGDADACEQAISLGARDFIEKIQDADPKTAESFRLLLKLKLKMQAEVRHGISLHHPGVPPAKRKAAQPLDIITSTRLHTPRIEFAKEGIIAIGASLGGTETTLQILQRLPKGLPGIVIVQHMPPEYTKAYALRLDRCCAITVREAENGDLVLPGTALVAQGGRQFSVYRGRKGYCVQVDGKEKVGGFCPSVDVLFQSVAEAAGANALGVILTGMGKDGAKGLKQMHDKKAYTIGQNKETCAVFGMPCAAWDLGGVDKLLPPELIAREIIRYSSNYEKKEGE
jgi:two-component system chemotaxis response regulator CheB